MTIVDTTLEVIDLTSLDWDHEPPCESGPYHVLHGDGHATLRVVSLHKACGVGDVTIHCQACIDHVMIDTTLMVCAVCRDTLPHLRDNIINTTSIKALS